MQNKWSLLVLVVMVLCLAGCRQPHKLCVRQSCYKVDVVSDVASRERGLMFRDTLLAKTGMLFVFDHEDIYPFWMKNMNFPIDILWLDSAKRVTFIAANVPPCKSDPCPVYTPTARAAYVLEIPAGDAVRYKMIVGDQLQ